MALFFLAGCSSSALTLGDGGFDLSGSDGPRGDLAGVADGFVPSCSVTGAHKAQFVADTITLPVNKNQYALDLNGDGKADNQLGNIVSALASQGVSPQTNLNTALSAGTEVLLVDEISSDPTFTTDACAGSNLFHGQNHAPGPPPQTYVVDSATPPGRFTGPIAKATFDSSSPVTGPDVQVTLFLPLTGSTLLPLPLHGAHLTYKSNGSTLAMGQLNGAIKSSDVQTVIVPALAANLEAQVQANPSSMSSQQILAIFDVGNGSGGPCTNPDGSLGQPGDGHIAVCEVAGNGIIQSILAPDVQMFQGGVYQPNPANTTKDSLSLGVAFTAVAATF